MPKGKSAISPADKAANNPTSMKYAIAAYCYHNCFGEEAVNSHTTKMLIRDCKNTACHLYPHRGWRDVTGGNVNQGKNSDTLTEKTTPSITRKAR